ncbi:hypothetical protein [Capillimicrobium parvum]|uniref:Uncharacterized protein n=1 Tax=Capillimicrobium parvum TaxID=2884022 RepID=A0A9E6XWG9_9ACTN|nr:hypothetical protein [Capillimicrobium parvum]UGS35762.1 hypothetical protein DSM104329_02157 [Capillimicrobium parvum]
MSYSASGGRRQLLDTLAEATDRIGDALAALGVAYEQLDEHHGDELEAALFRPVQAAYGRAQRTYADFAARYGLPARAFEPGSAGPASAGAWSLIEDAVDAAGDADETIATLQDSLLPIEVGDPEVRAGLSAVRELLGPVPARAREVVRTLGR